MNSKPVVEACIVIGVLEADPFICSKDGYAVCCTAQQAEELKAQLEAKFPDVIYSIVTICTLEKLANIDLVYPVNTDQNPNDFGSMILDEYKESTL